MKTDRPKPPSEEQIQSAVIKWWGAAHAGLKVALPLLMHTPNGGGRSIIQAVRLKRMGVRAGWPDLFLAVPRWQYEFSSTGTMNRGSPIPIHGLFIEMKAAKGRIAPEQTALHDLLRNQGYSVVICRTLEETISAIEGYLKGAA